MKNIKFKLTSILLTILMIVGMMPQMAVPVYAEEHNSGDIQINNLSVGDIISFSDENCPDYLDANEIILRANGYGDGSGAKSDNITISSSFDFEIDNSSLAIISYNGDQGETRYYPYSMAIKRPFGRL